MSVRPLIAAALIAFLLAPDGAEAQQQALPREVQALEREIRESCSGAPGRLRTGAVQSADFNGDGRPDYVVYFGAVDCPGGTPGFCGSGGCRTEVLLSTPSGYREGMESGLGGPPQIVRGSGLPILRLLSREGPPTCAGTGGHWRLPAERPSLQPWSSARARPRSG